MDWMLGKGGGGGGVKKMHATARGSQDDAGGETSSPQPKRLDQAPSALGAGSQ